MSNLQNTGTSGSRLVQQALSLEASPEAIAKSIGDALVANFGGDRASVYADLIVKAVQDRRRQIAGMTNE